MVAWRRSQIARIACVGLIVFSGLAHAEELPDKDRVLSNKSEAIDSADLTGGEASQTHKTEKKPDVSIAKVRSPLSHQRRSSGSMNSSALPWRLASSERQNLYRPIFLILGVAF